MNRIQTVFAGMAARSSTRKAAMEAESRTWMIRCTFCGYERSVWETGGVMYKASGNSRQLRRCPHCGKLSWHLTYRQTGPPGTAPPPPAATRARPRPLLWVLGLGLLVAAIVGFVVLLLLGLSAVTQPLVTRGDTFMSALQTGNYPAAYALCTPALQQQLGGAPGLAALVQGSPPSRWSWTNRSIRNGAGSLDGNFTYADGKPGTVHLALQQVGDAWQIAGFRLNPT